MLGSVPYLLLLGPVRTSASLLKKKKKKKKCWDRDLTDYCEDRSSFRFLSEKNLETFPLPPSARRKARDALGPPIPIVISINLFKVD